MKEVVNKSVYRIRVALAAFTCFFGIMIFFINSDFLHTLLARGLNMHVDPSFTGGVVAADFFDDTEDADSAYDLVRYTVHEPVYNARWQTNADYWQLDLFFSGEAKNGRNIKISLGLDKNDDYATMIISGQEAKVYDWNGNFICNGELNSKENGKIVKVRIPLKDKNLQKIYTAKESRHYILVNADSNAALDSLGSENEPLIANMQITKSKNKDEEKLFKADVYKKLEDLSPAKDSESASNGQYYGYQSLDQALEALEEAININPDSAIDLCHYGVCLAMKGGQSSVFKAVAYVNKAYEYLDKAVELSKTEEELNETLMNRAGVSKSVPESVFGKALSGAEDFSKLARIQKAHVSEMTEGNIEYEKYVLAYLYLSASECYKSAGKESESILMLQEAKKAVE